MNNIEFTQKEAAFISRIMKGFEDRYGKSSPIYISMLEKLLVQITESDQLVTDNAHETINGILYKIAMSKATQEIENMLTDPFYGIDAENTKAASYNKVLNITEKHQEIIDLLKNTPKLSRREIASCLGWSINRVCPRVRELQDLGALKTSGTKWDDQTQRNVEILEVA